VAILGPGILAGIIAIGLRSIGFIGKLLYEAIEETDRNQIEAVTATGASPAQVLNYGHRAAGHARLLGDHRVPLGHQHPRKRDPRAGRRGRASGLKLQASLNVLAWPQVTMILIVILATVVVSEWVSARVRARSSEPGHYAHLIGRETGIRPKFFGKPFASIFDLARERMGPDVDPSRVVMVGDTPQTDILGGQLAGHATALVTGYGLMAGLDVRDVMERSGIVPDYLLPTP
jgi:hypothetical protein